MTRREPDLEQLLANPSADPDERAEAEWLLARDAAADAPAPSADVARDHAQLEDLLATLPVGRDDDRWQDAVLAAARADASTVAEVVPLAPRTARRRWARVAVMGGALAAAAVVIFLVTRPPATSTAELQVATRRIDPARGGSTEVLVGDHLEVRVRPRGPTELRIYQGPDVLLLRCPGAPGCAAAEATWKVDVAVSAPVPHHVIVTFGDVAASPAATMDDYLAAARRAGARVVIHPTIDVH